MRGSKLKRAVSTALLALSALQGAASAALAGSSPAPHTCEDHVCFCRKPAAAAPKAPCHGGAEEDGPRLAAACNHDADPVTLAPLRPGLLPAAVLLAGDPGWRPVPKAVTAPAADVFHPIESPPPRPARPRA